MSRGNGKMAIFLDATDYRKFIYLLGDIVEQHGIECWDFCLMPNHYHLTLLNVQVNLAAAIRHLNGCYGCWWNARHHRVGHVFQGRYKDQLIQEDLYLSNLTRYIALNPVRAELVAHPREWPWSSYRAFAGLAENPGFLTAEPVWRACSEDCEHWPAAYAAHVARQPEEEQVAVEERLRSREIVLGTPAFKRRWTVPVVEDRDVPIIESPVVAENATPP